MAEINVSSANSRHGKPSIKVDLTPMVDLGFLLIAFFMFTTTLTRQKVMDVNLPDRSAKEATVFIDTATITIIPVLHHQCVYYTGGSLTNESVHQIGLNNIRSVITNKQRELSILPSTFSEQAHKLHVIIKPSDYCSYEDVVTLLDEMTINGVPYYTIGDLSAEEVAIMTNKLHSIL